MEVDPMDKRQQCQAKSKRSGLRCKKYAVKGMKVCCMHGGILGSKKAQELRRQAALRYGLYAKEALQEKKKVQMFLKSCRRALI